jgi:hypothetical protein
MSYPKHYSISLRLGRGGREGKPTTPAIHDAPVATPLPPKGALSASGHGYA